MNKLSTPRLPVGLEAQSALDFLQNPVVLIDTECRIVAVNNAYRTYYGADSGNLCDRRYCEAVSLPARRTCPRSGAACPHQNLYYSGDSPEQEYVQNLQLNYDVSAQAQVHSHILRDLLGTSYFAEEIIPLRHRRHAMQNQHMPMVGHSSAFLRCVELLEKAAQTQANILLLGESGVGKELAAHAVHRYSQRSAGPLLTVDCSTLPEHLFESEFLGHEQGAFTGCTDLKKGLYERAHNGTLFLDEIGELPLALQAKLLRVLETGTFRRLGGSELLSADVRIVAASNRDLRQMVRDKIFREDLYYRLAAISINIPPLRERQEDIPQIAEALVSDISHAWGGQWRLSQRAAQHLKAYPFPGNIRELRNILQRAIAFSDEHVILPKHLHSLFPQLGIRLAMTRGRSPMLGRPENFPELLHQFAGNRRQLAQHVGVSERTLYRWLQQNI